RALADDLRRFLAGEPILARPVSRAERLGRWCRRNPALAAATGLAAAALVAASVVSTGWAIREHDHAQALRRERDEAALQVAQNYLDNGLALCERGDIGPGLLTLARALERAPAGAEPLDHAARTQLAGWGRVCP